MLDQPVTYLIHCIVENGILDTGYWMLDNSASSIQHRVSGIRYKDIAAMVGEVDTGSVEKFDEEQLRDCVAAYEQANLSIFQRHTMAPLRFGVMVDTKEEIERFLVANYIHIKASLARIEGKGEFTVLLFWDLQEVLQNIRREEELVSWHSATLNAIEMGRRLFEIAERKKEKLIDTVHHKLSAVSLDSSEARLTDESMIMKRSYLFKKAEEAAFDQAIAELGEETESYLRIKYVGPGPPYSFTCLEFSEGNFDLVDDARKILSLPERARFEDIKSSYRRLSLKHHPDKNPGDQRSSERFRQIDEAYKILEMYCSSCVGSLLSRQNAEYSFAKDDVESTFIVREEI